MCAILISTLIKTLKDNIFQVVFGFNGLHFMDFYILFQGEACYDFFPMDC